MVRTISKARLWSVFACMLSFAWLATVLAAPIVSAQAVSQNNLGTGNSLKISPLRSDITLYPGESREVSVFVENIETKPVRLKPVENDFVAGDDEKGIPAIILDENEYAPTHSLKRFMTPIPEIVVGPAERKEVRVPISVPANAQSGGYFGAIRFVPINTDGTENVQVSGSVASLILLTVPGNLIESLNTTDFEILQDDKPVSRLENAEKVSVSIRLENKGNIQVAPYGNLSLLKDGKVLFSKAINDIQPAGVILPDSARKFVIPVENIGSFGKYTFKATIGYGANGGGDTMEMERSIWVIPSTYIFAAIGGLAVLILIVTMIIVALRSYKKKILRSARRR